MFNGHFERRSTMISKTVFLVLISLALAASPTSSIPAQADEFVGPFPSWTNVKTVYGAVADGTADDTAAIQQGLDELGKPGHSPVLFFPFEHQRQHCRRRSGNNDHRVGRRAGGYHDLVQWRCIFPVCPFHARR